MRRPAPTSATPEPLQSPPQTPPQTKGEETRAAILDQALASASRLGLEGLTIGNLADAVGMSKSGLFAHFRSKEDLQLQVLETAVRHFVELVLAPALARPRGEPRVRSLFERWIEWEKADFQPGGCIFIATANELDDRPGPLRDRLVGYQRDWLQAIATAARIAVEEKHFAPEVDVQQFAYDLYAIALAYHHFSRLMDDPAAEDRAKSAFERLMDAARLSAASPG
jgi:AcrR family transcriptional regulator